MASVYPDHPIFQCLGDAPDAGEIARIKIGGEAELGGIGQGDRIGFVFEGKSAATGPKVSSRVIRMVGVAPVRTVGA